MKQNNYNEMINGVINHNRAAEKALSEMLYNYAYRSVKKFSSSFDKETINDIAQDVVSETYIFLTNNDCAKLRDFSGTLENFKHYLSSTISFAVLKTVNSINEEKATHVTLDTTGVNDRTYYNLFNNQPKDILLALVKSQVKNLVGKQKQVMDAVFNNIEHDNQLSDSELAHSLDMTPNNFARNKSAANANLRELCVDFRDICELDDLYCFAA